MTPTTLFDEALRPTLGPWRQGQPDTARQAALGNYPRTGTQRFKVLAALVRAGSYGATDYELHAAGIGARPHVAGTRRKELVDLGLVEATTDRRLTDTGSRAVVWRVTAAGVDVYREAS